MALKREIADALCLLKAYGTEDDIAQIKSVSKRLRGTIVNTELEGSIHDLVNYKPGLYGQSAELPRVPDYIRQHELLPSEVIWLFGHSDGCVARDLNDEPCLLNNYATVFRADIIVRMFLERFPCEQRQVRYYDFMREVAKFAEINTLRSVHTNR